jgi:hypothetical protein
MNSYTHNKTHTCVHHNKLCACPLPTLCVCNVRSCGMNSYTHNKTHTCVHHNKLCACSLPTQCVCNVRSCGMNSYTHTYIHTHNKTHTCVHHNELCARPLCACVHAISWNELVHTHITKHTPVSTTTNSVPAHSVRVYMRSRVMPGWSNTTATCANAIQSSKCACVCSLIQQCP